MFKHGDRIIRIETPSEDYDDGLIPIGATGTVISYDYEEPESIGVHWDERYESPNMGNTYSREVFVDELDTYINYENVWYISTISIILIQESKQKYHRIINKIKTLDDKAKTKTLRLRKIKKMPFPDLVSST